MNWTTTAPGEPGWYWMQKKGQFPEVVEVTKFRGDGVRVWFNGKEDGELIGDVPEVAKWAGPIPQPT